jgi:hypothetical protein
LIHYEFEKPEEEPWFPEDITTASDDELGRLLSLYTLWTNYAAFVLAKDESKLLVLKEELEIIRAKEMIKCSTNERLRADFKAKDDREAYVTSIPEVSDKMMEVIQLAANVKLEKVVAENFDKRYFSASRELTRRKG